MKENANAKFNDLKTALESLVDEMKTAKDAMKNLEVRLTTKSEEVISSAKANQLAVDLDAKKEAVRRVRAFSKELIDEGLKLQTDTPLQIALVFDIEPLCSQYSTLTDNLRQECERIMDEGKAAGDEELRNLPLVATNGKKRKQWYCANALCDVSGVEEDTAKWTSCSVKGCKSYNMWFCPVCADVLAKHERNFH